MGEMEWSMASVAFQNPILKDTFKDHKFYISAIQRVQHTNLINSLEHHVFISDTIDHLSHLVHRCHSLNIKHLVVWMDGVFPTATEITEVILEDIEEAEKDVSDWVIATREEQTMKCRTFFVINVCNALNLKAHAFLSQLFSQKSIRLGGDYEECIYDLDAANEIEKTTEFLREPYDPDREYQVPDESELSEVKCELFNFKNMSSTQLYVTNTENVPNEIIVPADKIIVPCSGLNQVYYAMTSIDTLKEIVWFDFNDGAIEWTKNHLMNWSGENFKDYYEQEIVKFQEKFPLHTDVIYNADQVDDFMYEVEDYCEDIGGWLPMWERIQNLKHTFIKLDIVNDGHVVLKDHISKDENVFLQISNIWQYEQNYLNSQDFDVYENWIKLVNMAKKNSKNLWLSGDSPYGKHYYRQDMGVIGSIY